VANSTYAGEAQLNRITLLKKAHNNMKQLEQRLISLEGKGLGAVPAGCRQADVAGLGWNLLNEDVSLPVAVLSQSRLRHNLQWMQTFVALGKRDAAFDAGYPVRL